MIIREFFWDERNWFGPENAAGRPSHRRRDGRAPRRGGAASRAASRSEGQLDGAAARGPHSPADGQDLCVSAGDQARAGRRRERRDDPADGGVCSNAVSRSNGHRVIDWSPEMVRALDAAMVILDAFGRRIARRLLDPCSVMLLRWCMRASGRLARWDLTRRCSCCRELPADMGALLGRCVVPACKTERVAPRKSHDYSFGCDPTSHIRTCSDQRRGHGARPLVQDARSARRGVSASESEGSTRRSDALQTIEYRGVIVEVQFHFECVIALKKFSHVAYNLDRFADDPAAGRERRPLRVERQSRPLPGLHRLHTVDETGGARL